jgi:hypothetical protein
MNPLRLDRMAKELFRVAGVTLTLLGAMIMLFTYTGTIAIHTGASDADSLRLIVVDWITPMATFVTGIFLILFATPLAKLVGMGIDPE